MKQLKQVCLILLLFAGRLSAAPIVSGNSGNWNNPATWAGGIVPSAGDNVTIANGHTVTVTANAACASLVIGNGLLNQSTTLTFSPGIALAITGNITITAPLSGAADNTLDVNDGLVNCVSLNTSNSANNLQRCIVSINNGTLTCSFNFLMAANTDRNKLIFTGSGTLQMGRNNNTIADAQFTPATGTIEYNSNIVAQNILPLSYYSLKCSGTTSKNLIAHTVITGDLLIAGSAQLDAGNTGNYNLTVGGNWTVTSTNINPFIERKGTVIFNGISGVQVLTTPLVQESFYNLVISNTAGNPVADIVFNKTCFVSQAITYTSGITDLKGNRLTVVSQNNANGFVNCDLSGGSIISSVAGAQISFTDNFDSTLVNFTGTSVGSSTVAVPLTINTGRINIENLTLYGTGSFTKTLHYDDVAAKGGNKYYGAVNFTATASSGSWYSGTGNGALPDSFFAKADFYSFINDPVAKFILGANSAGNYYADSVSINNRSAATFLIGNSSGAANGTSSSHFFNKFTDVVVAGTGDIIFAEAQSLLPSSVTFNSKIRLGSAVTGTGNIYIGKNAAGSSISISNTGQLITGNIYGNTGIYFYNVTQTGSLSQVLTNQTTQTSKIIVGSLLSPCTWNGSVSFKASVLDLAYSNFNNSSYFTLNNSSSTQTYTGGNHFAAGTVTGFTNVGTADWQIAVTSGDDYNGDVLYQVNSGGAIYPAYNTNCTYAGSIVILPSSDSVIFAAAANGRVTLDGNTSGYFTNNSIKPSSIKRITMNKTAGLFTLYRNIFMPPGGDLSLVSGRLVTSATGMLILQDESCTVTANTSASPSYIDGPLRIDVSSTAVQTLHFPVGKGIESRPVDLTVQHTSNISYSYTTETVSASANALGWSNPASVNSVSTIRWWDITRTVTSSGTAAPLTDLVTSPLPVVAFYYGLNDRANIPANLTICKNTYNALTTWIDIGASGATNAIGKVTSTSLPSAFSSFSRFTLGYYGIPLPPVANDSSRCGTGTVTISATPVHGEAIDWYAAPTGGVPLATGSNTFTTPSVAVTTTYYAQARNTRGYISATRTAVKAIIYNTASITSFSPAVGEIGTSVIITGSNFTNVTGVSFGGTPAASYTVNSVTQITAVVAAGNTGAVSVNNNCGAATKPGFIYLPTTVWTGAVSNAWTLAGNWDDGVPTNIHCAIIPNVSTLPLISSNQAVKSITVQPGASIDIAAGNNLSVRDSITNNGSITGGGIVLLDGSASQAMSGTGTYNNLTLNNTAGAIIKSGAGNMVNITGTYTPTAGTLTTNTNFTLKSNASSTGIITTGAAAGGYINGKITLERFVPAKRAWRLINFPVTAAAVPDINTSLQEGAGGNASVNPNPGFGTHITGGTIAAGFDQNTNNSASMKEWDGTAWQGIASTNQPISNSLPYFLFVRGSRANNLSLGTGAPADNTVLRLTANVKQGNQSIPLSGTGWQLTGNPFPSMINLDAVAVSNNTIITRNFKYWDPKLGGSNNVGGFVTASYNGFDYDFVPAPVSQLSEYAQPFSGFYVDAIATGNISIAETAKCNCGYGNVFRPAPSNSVNSKLYIDLHSVNSDGTSPVVDGVLAAFNDRYSNNIDQYDAKKLFNSIAENISITTNNNKVSVERRRAIVYADTLFLDLSNMKARNYQFEIRPENFDSRSTTAYLEDSYTAERKAIDLSAANLLNFSIVNVPGSYAKDRFRIVFEKEMVAVISGKTFPAHNNTANGNIRLLQNPVTGNQLKLEFKGMPKGSYLLTILDKEGKEIARKKIDHYGSDAVKMISIKNYLPAGIQVANIKGTSGNNISFNIMVQ